MQYKHKLKELRLANKLTQKQIGAILNTTQQHYALYESNQRSMPIELYIALANYYNCTIDELCGRKPYIERQEIEEQKDTPTGYPEGVTDTSTT